MYIKKNNYYIPNKTFKIITLKKSKKEEEEKKK
jgi:hypothetical protein